MNFELTKWHEENPNEWIALEMTDKPKRGWGRDPNRYILRGRAKTLKELVEVIGDDNGYTFGSSWGMGIGKDMQIGESRDEYYKRLGYI